MMQPLATAVLLISAILAQDPAGQDGKKPTSQPGPNAKAAIEAWLASENNRQLCEKAAIATLQEREKGMELLASYLPKEGAAVEPGQEKRLKAIDVLLQNYLAMFLQVQRSSLMTYAGQYAPLRTLMPHAGRVYLKLVVETPDWFQEEFRVSAIAALRDLYKDSPGESPMNEMRKLAKDEEFEREQVREAVAYALAQWGDREFADKRLAAIRKDIESAKEADQFDQAHRLPDAYYSMREFDKAAAEWRDWMTKAEKPGRTIVPSDYYNAACSLSLSGDVDGAIAALEKCLKLQTGGGVDASQRVDERLFRGDPDLANVRKNPRFIEMVKDAFQKGGAKKAAKDGEGKDAGKKQGDAPSEKK